MDEVYVIDINTGETTTITDEEFRTGPVDYESNLYMGSVRHLAELSGFLNDWQTNNTSTKYQALLGNQNKGRYGSLTKEDMKKVAHVLKFKEWRVLIHPEVDPNTHDKKKQSEDYLKEIAKIEAEFDEK